MLAATILAATITPCPAPKPHHAHHKAILVACEAQSWDQANLKRADSGCPSAVFVAPGGELEQCDGGPAEALEPVELAGHDRYVLTEIAVPEPIACAPLGPIGGSGAAPEVSESSLAPMLTLLGGSLVLIWGGRKR